MQNINIGKSGIAVPFLGMGTWAIGGGAWWGDNDDSLSVKAIQTAVEQGIQWIDTAPIYGLYHSETVVGEAMKHIDRDKVVLSTKCGLEWRHETPVLHKVVDGTTVYRDLSAKSIIEDVEDSLRRLHTDHLDVLYTHWQTPDFGIYPLEETVEAMMKLKEQGKIRAIGASNVTADIIRGYCKYGQLDVIQEKYSLLTRRVEKQLLPTCRELGVSVQAYSPLEQGLLTGKVTMEDMRRSRGLLNRASQFFKSAPETLMERLEQQASEMKALRQALEKFKSEASMGEAKQILASAKTVDGLHVITGTRQGLDANALRLMGDFLRDKEPKVVAVLAAVNGEKITFLAVCGKEAVARGIKAGDLVRAVSAVCGGKGGGKPDSAMGGGTELLKVDDALASVDDFVSEKLS